LHDAIEVVQIDIEARTALDFIEAGKYEVFGMINLRSDVI
jgi:hypothetical protein